MSSDCIKKLIIIFIVILMIFIFAFIGYKFYENTLRITVNDDYSNFSKENFIEINSNNYTDILKDSHNNINNYVGKKVKFTGFIYRLYDFSEDEFVLAREMIISSDNQAVVVGFLCRSGEVSNFFNRNDKCWVEVEGTIVKGNYHGDLPVIEVNSIKETNVPVDEYVYPPSDSYVNTEI